MKYLKFSPKPSDPPGNYHNSRVLYRGCVSRLTDRCSSTYAIEICKATNNTAIVTVVWFISNLGEINYFPGCSFHRTLRAGPSSIMWSILGPDETTHNRLSSDRNFNADLAIYCNRGHWCSSSATITSPLQAQSSIVHNYALEKHASCEVVNCGTAIAPHLSLPTLQHRTLSSTARGSSHSHQTGMCEA